MRRADIPAARTVIAPTVVLAQTAVVPTFRRRQGCGGLALASAKAVRSALIHVERVLLVIGALLLGWYGLEQLQIAYDQATASRELEAVSMAVPAPRVAGRLRLAAGAVVGRVDIPRVGVSAVVREGDDAGTLRRAVGHIPGTALPGERGNAALAGHRDSFFRGLRDIRAGDDIVLSTPAGDAHYVVRATRVVDPSDVSVLAPTPRSMLTLVTCYPFNYVGAAPRRFIVHAELAH